MTVCPFCGRKPDYEPYLSAPHKGLNVYFCRNCRQVLRFEGFNTVHFGRGTKITPETRKRKLSRGTRATLQSRGVSKSPGEAGF